MSVVAINTEFVFNEEFTWPNSVDSAIVSECFPCDHDPMPCGTVEFRKPVLLNSTEVRCTSEFDTVVKVGSIVIPVIDYSDSSCMQLEDWDEFGSLYNGELTTAEREFVVCSAAMACDDFTWYKHDEEEVEDPEYDGKGYHLLFLTDKSSDIAIAVNMEVHNWKVIVAATAVKYYNDMCLAGLLRGPDKSDKDYARESSAIVHWYTSSNK